MNYIKKHWFSILTSLFLIVIGFLLLINPKFFDETILKITGIICAVSGVFHAIDYFRTNAKDAAKGSDLFLTLTLVSVGLFCIFDSGWFLHAFSVLAVLYGLLQILFGFRKLQRTVDGLRTNAQLWYLDAIAAGVSILFGFLIVCNPNMQFIGVWTLTGLAMLSEGIFEIVIMCLQSAKE